MTEPQMPVISQRQRIRAVSLSKTPWFSSPCRMIPIWTFVCLPCVQCHWTQSSAFYLRPFWHRQWQRNLRLTEVHKDDHVCTPVKACENHNESPSQWSLSWGCFAVYIHIDSLVLPMKGSRFPPATLNNIELPLMLTRQTHLKHLCGFISGDLFGIARVKWS